jgi:protein-disulfide isomerase
MSSKKPFWIIISATLVTLIIGLFILKRHGLIVREIDTTNQPSLGSPKAKIHVVVFEDLKCRACKTYSNDYFPLLKQKYIDTNKIDYSTILLAFISGSPPAANAAYCMYDQNPDFFYPFIETIYAKQPNENLDWATPANLLDFASNISTVNLETLQSCMQANTYADQLKKNYAQASKLMNKAISTPTIYINGIKVDPLSASHIDQMIEEAS